jgi:hypothetical protein
MKFTLLLVSALTAGLAVSPANAETLRYLGKHPDRSTAVIELGPREYFVNPGTEIPAWGRVKEVTDQHLVVEQALTDDQKHHMREQGALPYDTLEIHVPREDPQRPRGYTPPLVTK